MFPVYAITNWDVEDSLLQCLTSHAMIQSVGYSSGKTVNSSLLVSRYHQNLPPSFSERVTASPIVFIIRTAP